MRYKIFLFLAVLALLEIGCAFLLKNRYLNDEKSLMYAYDAQLGWFPEKNSVKIFRGQQNTEVRHNELGFRDDAPQNSSKPKIAFIGDSFVWGFGVEKNERFTEFLRRDRPDWEVLNWGVSGYGTDQEYLLLQRQWGGGQRLQTVCLVFCHNDRSDNSSNMAYGYYKPYFVKQDGRLQLRGVPAPVNAMFIYKNLPAGLNRSSLALVALKIWEKMRARRAIQVPDLTADLVRATKQFVESKGSRFILAMVDKDAGLEQFCREEPAACVDLSSWGDSYRFKSYGNHWNPRGHEAVSHTLENFIKQ